MGVVFEIQRFCVHDGPGIRTTVFLKGCPLHCIWCHNPEGISPRPQIAYHAKRCMICGGCMAVCMHGVHRMIGQAHHVDFSRCIACGKCVSTCPSNALSMVGREITVGEVLDSVLQDVPFYAMAGGVTFSGGECTLQPDFLLALLMQAKQCKLNTAVDTCGAAPWTVLESLLPFTDRFLYDLKLLDSQQHILATGVGNSQILDNYHRLVRAGAMIEIRIPIIPTVNDSQEALERIFDFLMQCGLPEKITLIPFHSPGMGKYSQLGLQMWEPKAAMGLDVNQWQRYADQLCKG